MCGGSAKGGRGSVGAARKAASKGGKEERKEGRRERWERILTGKGAGTKQNVTGETRQNRREYPQKSKAHWR